MPDREITDHRIEHLMVISVNAIIHQLKRYDIAVQAGS